MTQVSKKPDVHPDVKEVAYTAERWTLLRGYREKAAQLMEALERFSLLSVVHGSIARGDVTKRSDVDVFVPDMPSGFRVESALEAAGISVLSRMVVQATPAYTMKAYVEIDEAATVSFALMRMRKVEREFYRFSGEISLQELHRAIRVPGVDKRLKLIQPTEKGHVESSIMGREEETAKTLGVSVETVLDRVHALMKRDAVGRTGVFVKRELASDETFEMALKRLADANPAVRRRLKSAE